MYSGPKLQPIDKRVFTVLFRRYRRLLSRFARNNTRDPQQIDDFVQESFTRMMHGASLPGVKHCKAYLFQTLRNLLTETGLRQQREKDAVTFNSEDVDAQLERKPPEDSSELDLLEAEDALTFGMEQLPQRWRRVMELHCQELSDAEIAEKLGISVDSVRHDRMHARRELREHLWPEGQRRSAK